MLRRALTVLLTLTAALMLAVALAFPAAAAPYCGITWGSGVKTNAAMGTGEVDTVRTGINDCFDRVVIDIDGPAAGWRAEYVDAVRADGSGNIVPTPGPAKIQFTVHHPWYSGPAAGTPLANVTGYPVLRSVVSAGSFEGHTTFGVGVRARLPMRVFALAGPGGHSRLVLDVARQWEA